MPGNTANWRVLEGAMRWLRDVEKGSMGMPGAGSFMARMWPVFLLAIVSGVAFDLAKWVITDVRRRIYNKNRNRKYAERKDVDGKKRHKNMKWRTERIGKIKRARGMPLSAPPGFAEALCRQWDKVRDSLEEMIRFGEMMIELEDYVDNEFIFNGAGDIIGRHPGVKGFLAENCPHIGYVTAIRYRILAMKAREVARKQGKPLVQCRTLRELEGQLDGGLGVVKDRHLEEPRRRGCRRRGGRDPQPAIFAVREAVHSVGKLDAPCRRRIINALSEITRELAVS